MKRQKKTKLLEYIKLPEPDEQEMNPEDAQSDKELKAILVGGIVMAWVIVVVVTIVFIVIKL